MNKLNWRKRATAGTPAVFTVLSNAFITTTVPAGATSGKILVVTPTGKLPSNAPFHVTP